MTEHTIADGKFAIAPAALHCLPVDSSDRLFPVNRVFCIGRNYAAHAVEMGHDPNKEAPFFFLKHASAVTSDGVFPYPGETSDVHYEVEMVVTLHKGGRAIAQEQALDHVWGYAVGLDMTRRDLQGEAKKLGRPWEVAKSFEKSAPCGPLMPASQIGHPQSGRISLTVNEEVRQDGDLNQLIWKVPEIVSVLSRYFDLVPGDIIMTGTPAGVGSIVRGDTMYARIDGIGETSVTVV